MSVNFDQEISRKESGSIKWNPQLIEKWCGFSGENVDSFWVADMDFLCPQPVREAVEKVAQHGIYGYSDFTSSYYDSVIGWYRRRFGCEVKREWICYSNGIVPALNYIIQSRCRPGDKLLLQTPVYYPFLEAVRDHGLEMGDAPLRSTPVGYEMDLEALERQAADPKAKIMFLCSPHNPVGRVWNRQELTAVMEICRKHQVLVVADEIHCDIVFGESKHITLLSMTEYLDNVIVCSSPSKTFNIAGLQTSNIIIPNDAIRKDFCQTLHANGILLPNPFGAAAAQAAYEQGEEWLEQLLRYLEGNLDAMEEYISANMPGCQWQRPQGTYLAWLRFADRPDSSWRKKRLEEAGKIALDHGSIFGQAGEEFERINFACPRRVLLRGLEKMKRSLYPEI